MAGKDKPVSNAVKTIEPVTTPVQQTTTSQSTIGEFVKTTKYYWNACTKQCNEWKECEQLKELNARRQKFARTICHPLGDVYRALPRMATYFKFQKIQPYNYKDRLIVLEAISLIFAIRSLRARNNLGLTQRVLFAVRNSIFVFALGGLFIAPQIYNPLIKSDF